ncbi:hypothetical protein YQE_03029, partial [Dendroctonus ponderosae]
MGICACGGRCAYDGTTWSADVVKCLIVDCILLAAGFLLWDKPKNAILGRSLDPSAVNIR